jgi:hypothetical protein
MSIPCIARSTLEERASSTAASLDSISMMAALSISFVAGLSSRLACGVACSGNCFAEELVDADDGNTIPRVSGSS